MTPPRQRSAPSAVRRRLRGLVALCATLPAIPAGAERIRPESWSDRFGQIEELVGAGRWKQALPLSRRLVDEMAQGLGSGEAATEAMASSVALLALAEAGLGRADDAAWHWSFAVSLRPELAATQLDHFGAAGELLESRRDTWEPREEDRPAAGGGATGETPPREAVQPPRKKSAPDPQSTAGLRAAGREEKVVIGIVIGADGALSHPRILVHQFPGYAFVVAETVRRWRFEPARLDGEPVATHYNLLITWSD